VRGEECARAAARWKQLLRSHLPARRERGGIVEWLWSRESGATGVQPCDALVAEEGGVAKLDALGDVGTEAPEIVGQMGGGKLALGISGVPLKGAKGKGPKKGAGGGIDTRFADALQQSRSALEAPLRISVRVGLCEGDGLQTFELAGTIVVQCPSTRGRHG
jgi:hypothetical protein